MRGTPRTHLDAKDLIQHTNESVCRIRHLIEAYERVRELEAIILKLVKNSYQDKDVLPIDASASTIPAGKKFETK